MFKKKTGIFEIFLIGVFATPAVLLRPAPQSGTPLCFAGRGFAPQDGTAHNETRGLRKASQIFTDYKMQRSTKSVKGLDADFVDCAGFAVLATPTLLFDLARRDFASRRGGYAGLRRMSAFLPFNRGLRGLR